MRPLDFDLDRPGVVEDGWWKSVEKARERTLRAMAAGDRGQAVGSAKDLVETLARIVLTIGGDAVPANAPYQSVVTSAHKALDRQPGVGLTRSEPLRTVAQSAKTIA